MLFAIAIPPSIITPGPLGDHTLPSAVKSPDILLLDRPRDKRNVRLACSRANRLSVVAVIHLPLHEWLDLLCANGPGLATKRLELADPAKNACTGFDNNRAPSI